MTPSPAFPAGMKAALSLTFDVDAECAILADSPAAWRDAMAMTHQAFGPRVAIPRILRILAEEKVQGTFFIPGWTARRWPQVVQQVLEGGHEVGLHSDTHRPPTTLTADEERADMERAMESLGALGATPVGHRAAWWQATWTTLDLVGEFGLRYDSSLMDDDRPYVLRIGDRRVAELPPHWSLDDWEQYGFLPNPNIGSQIESPKKVFELWSLELDAQRSEGGLVVGTMHPFLSGRASRVEVIRQLIDHARISGDVWIAPLHEIAERTLTAAGIDERAPNPPDLAMGPYSE